MATTASPPGATRTPKIEPGVAPLRAGQGRRFLLRRLHSLSGIIPVGAFLLEHFISNAFATNGPIAYTDQVKFLTGLPFAFWLEVFGIYIPILFHALYGFYIWYTGESNVADYPWAGNWMYTAQRWTGAIAFAYILYHTWYMRFSGVHLFDHPEAAFWKVQNEFQNPWAVAAYVVGIVTASWHFAYGVWLFAAKWGITVGDRARRRFGVVCTALGALLIVVGLYTMWVFLQPRPDWPPQRFQEEWRHPPAQAVPGETNGERT
jgi:succinate dehydrogenase / fumarate reductase cytochrome b subunit